MDLELEQEILNHMRDIERYDEDNFEEENPEKEKVLSLSDENTIEGYLNDLELSTADMNLFNHISSGKQRTLRDFRDNFKDLTTTEADSDNVDSTLPHPTEQSSNYFKVLRDKASDIFNEIAKGCKDIRKSEEDKDNSLGDVDLSKVMDEVEEIEQRQLIYDRNGASTSKASYDADADDGNMPYVIITTNRADNKNTANDVTNNNERSNLLNPSITDKEVTLASNDIFVTRPKMRVLRRKAERQAKNQLDKTHIYSFFSSMGDQVSTLPYDSTLTAKSKVTSLLEDMVKKLKDWNDDSSPHKLMRGYELNDEDIDFITMKLSRLPYVY